MKLSWKGSTEGVIVRWSYSRRQTVLSTPGSTTGLNAMANHALTVTNLTAPFGVEGRSSPAVLRYGESAEIVDMEASLLAAQVTANVEWHSWCVVHHSRLARVSR